MRITFVLPYAGLQGGIRVIAIYANILKRRGHELTIVSDPEVVTLRRKVKSLLLGRGLPKPEPSYFDGIDLEHRVLERTRPVTDADVPDADVVIATYYTTAEGVLRLSPAKGAKAIFIQNYEVEEGKTNAKLDATWRMPFHKITISKWLVELARDKFDDTVVSHVPNSVDMKQFDAAPREKQPVPTVGLLYNTFSLKGLNTSLAALERVAEVLPSLRVIAFGAEEPDFRFPLPKYAQFHHRPPQDSIRNLYAQCDVWMCGSNVEGFHLPPLEAMACRCPVVSTRVGGPMDIIEEGVNGHLVEVKDARGLADRTLGVLNLSPEKWKMMSDAAYGTATRFTWEEAATLFEQALEFAIERNRRGELQPPREVVA
ncbi:MAG: glycosyltransferase family 4 protein [Verrucomicrobia bacterium]|nr:glycosyltransferase family 4 protein [Verrucomicrobiota bacterium]